MVRFVSPRPFAASPATVIMAVESGTARIGGGVVMRPRRTRVTPPGRRAPVGFLVLLALFLGGCSDGALPAGSAGTSPAKSPLAATSADPCSTASSPSPVPRLTIAVSRNASLVSSLCIVSTGSNDNVVRHIRQVPASYVNENNWRGLAPFDGDKLPAGCSVSQSQRAYASVDNSWYEMRAIGCDAPTPSAASS